jgi:hypothetical protein
VGASAEKAIFLPSGEIMKAPTSACSVFINALLAGTSSRLLPSAFTRYR